MVVSRPKVAEKLVSLLEQSSEGLTVPTLVPLRLLEMDAEGTASSINSIRGRVQDAAHETGLHAWADGQYVNTGQADLVEISATLTKAAQHMAGTRKEIQAFIRIQEKVQNMHGKCLRKRRTHDPKVLVEQAIDDMSAQLDHVAEHALDLLARADQIHAEIQANVQTVYSMTASRDNEQNRRAAEASVHLAEVTRRDSADMRVIAAVTLIFLPATFVATLFSTSFFNFAPREPQKLVSHWIWLYWTVAITLTALVMAGWLFMSRAMKNRDVWAFETRRQYGGGGVVGIGDPALHPQREGFEQQSLSGSGEDANVGAQIDDDVALGATGSTRNSEKAGLGIQEGGGGPDASKPGVGRRVLRHLEQMRYDMAEQFKNKLGHGSTLVERIASFLMRLWHSSGTPGLGEDQLEMALRKMLVTLELANRVR
ncbi:hypothetical protein LTR85_001471 [Meristemomyces frigidus]|nr:hypothetical protein LTR85_001471 [Meristemomyces frigidus]